MSGGVSPVEVPPKGPLGFSKVARDPQNSEQERVSIEVPDLESRKLCEKQPTPCAEVGRRGGNCARPRPHRPAPNTQNRWSVSFDGTTVRFKCPIKGTISRVPTHYSSTGLRRLSRTLSIVPKAQTPVSKHSQTPHVEFSIDILWLWDARKGPSSCARGRAPAPRPAPRLCLLARGVPDPARAFHKAPSRPAPKSKRTCWYREWSREWRETRHETRTRADASLVTVHPKERPEDTRARPKGRKV